MFNPRLTVSKMAATVALSVSAVISVPIVASATTANVSATLSTVSVSASSMAANGASTVQVTVTLFSSVTSQPVTNGGDVVVVTTSAGTVGAVTDNENGTYVATLSAPSSPAVATVGATVNGVALTTTASVNFGAGVTYNLLGGSGGPVDPNVYATGATVTMMFSPIPVKAGRFFVGWATTGPDPQTWFPVNMPTPTTLAFPGRPVTLYAVWAKRAPTTASFATATGTTMAAPATDSVGLNGTYQVHLVTNSDATPLYSAAPKRNCVVSNTGLVTASGGEQCTILVRLPATATHLPSAAVLHLTINSQAQSPLSITSTMGVHANPLVITTTGGSGTGAVYVGVVMKGSANCFTPDHLNVVAARAGSCLVVALKLGSGSYTVVTSALTTLTFS